MSALVKIDDQPFEKCFFCFAQSRKLLYARVCRQGFEPSDFNNHTAVNQAKFAAISAQLAGEPGVASIDG